MMSALASQMGKSNQMHFVTLSNILLLISIIMCLHFIDVTHFRAKILTKFGSYFWRFEGTEFTEWNEKKSRVRHLSLPKIFCFPPIIQHSYTLEVSSFALQILLVNFIRAQLKKVAPCWECPTLTAMLTVQCATTMTASSLLRCNY